MFKIHIKKQRSDHFLIDVNFHVHSGEIVVLMGKSGAGKSSILHAIAGLESLDQGGIIQDGKNYRRIPVHLRRFGYVKQKSFLFPHLTAFENITYNQLQSRSQLDEYIDVFELRPHLDKYPAQLSGGEARRVAIVRALMSDPQLLLLDEAFSSLDVTLRSKIRAYLKNHLNIPVVLVTHDPSEAAQMGDRILYLDQGKLMAEKDTVKKEIDLSVAILAGGEGKRLGGCNKAFLTIGKQTFIEQLLQQVSDFDDVILSTRHVALYRDYSPSILMDETPRIGPMGGLYTSLKHCKHDYLFVCAVDMPYLKKELIDFLSTFIDSESDAFIIESETKLHPLCGIYKKTAVLPIEEMIKQQNYQLTDLLKRLKTKVIPLIDSHLSDQIMTNVNTKDDLTQLQTPAVFCVSGVKNSGKTTLIRKLIKAFKEEGYRVGVIKHDGHEFDIDHEGTDTYQHRQAGSEQTLIYSNHQLAFMKKQDGLKIEEALRYFQGVDLILIEGLKDSSLPKIEVVSESSVCRPEHLLAVATDTGFIHSTVPTFKRSDIQKLVTLIKEKVVKAHER